MTRADEVLRMTDEEAITSAKLLGCEIGRVYAFQWAVLLPGARSWDNHFTSEGEAARAALLALLNPPT